MTHICVDKLGHHYLITACHLTGAKPLSKPMLTFYQLDVREQILINMLMISLNKMRLKMSAEGRPFCLGLNMLMLNLEIFQSFIICEKHILALKCNSLIQQYIKFVTRFPSIHIYDHASEILSKYYHN